MNRLRICILWLLSTACGSVIHTTPFNPAVQANPSGAYSPRALFDAKTAPKIGDRRVVDTAAVVIADGVAVTMALHRWDNVFDLTFMFENESGHDVTIAPEDFRLLAAGRTLMRQLPTHEAANLFLARTASYRPLPPKYVVDATTSTSFDGTVKTTATIAQDPFDAMGNSLAQAYIAHGNAQLAQMASMLYGTGMSGRETVPHHTRIARDVFWLAELAAGKPGADYVTVVLMPVRREVVFRSY